MKVAVTVLFIVALCACSQQQVNTASNTVTTDANVVASDAPVVVNDALIVAQIEGAFVVADPSSAVHVQVTSHAGVVSLKGRVKSDATRQTFLSKAKATGGVKGVASSLTVDPHLPSTQAQANDFAQAVAVEANLAGQAGINALSIHVDAHAGVVTLTGTADTAALRSTMLATAKKTAGVHAVIDHLTLKS